MPPSSGNFDKIALLCRDFYAESEHVARTLVQERGLPNEQRSIKERQDAGGAAGGVKVRTLVTNVCVCGLLTLKIQYCHQNIFYKFALDHKGLYRGDEAAMKSASHVRLSKDELLSY